MAKRVKKVDESVPAPEEPAPVMHERRKEARYIPVGRWGHLGWWEGDTYRTAAAWIESLSQSGAVLLVEEFAAGVEPVWVSLAGPVRSDWFLADVVGVSPSGGSGRLVRVALKQPLPYEVFKAVGLGLPTDSPNPST